MYRSTSRTRPSTRTGNATTSGDPHERENRAGDPAYAETAARLAGLFEEWWADTGGDVESWCAPLGE